MINDFEAELNAAVQATAPKRGRGRPRGANSNGEPTRPKPSKLNMSELKKQVSAVLQAANMIGLQYIKNYQFYQLQQDEIGPLSDALAGEINASPKIAALAAKVSQTSPHLQLASVLAQMALTRYTIAQQIKGNGPDGERNPSFEDSHPPVSHQNGRAYSSDWQDGERQDVFHLPLTPEPGVRPILAFES